MVAEEEVDAGEGVGEEVREGGSESEALSW
jgi:hypothetical protein